MSDGCTNTLRVLVVDDEIAIAESLAQILRLRGYNTHCAYSGESAIEALQAFEPQVLLADVVMTGMNGVELANRITRHRPDCRVVLFSGQAELSHTLADAHPAPHGYILYPKPVHPEVLLAMLEPEIAAQNPAYIPAKPPQSEIAQPLAIDRSTGSE